MHRFFNPLPYHFEIWALIMLKKIIVTYLVSITFCGYGHLWFSRIHITHMHDLGWLPKKRPAIWMTYAVKVNGRGRGRPFTATWNLGQNISAMISYDSRTKTTSLWSKSSYFKNHIAKMAKKLIESRLKKVNLPERALIFVGDGCWCFFTGSLLWGRVVTLERSRNLARAARPNYTKTLLIPSLFGTLIYSTRADHAMVCSTVLCVMFLVLSAKDIID